MSERSTSRQNFTTIMKLQSMGLDKDIDFPFSGCQCQETDIAVLCLLSHPVFSDKVSEPVKSGNC